jgi:SAM-dependent methyltransferase
MRPAGPDPRARQAAAFGAAAVEYERARPQYPEAALDWLLPAGARRVLDLGAGTGKLTRQLAACGLEVIAVEPLRGMREQLERALPDVRALAGRAEAIPLPDGAVDAVLVAQAWHWVDLERAVPEVARVLRPGGQLGLVWNTRDERVAWVREFGEILRGGAEIDMQASDPAVGPPFGTIERLDVPWLQRLHPATLLDLARSRSYVITLAPEEREALLARVEALLDTHPALAGRGEVELPYVTECSRTRRP